MTAIVALAMTTATQASTTHKHSANCPEDCSKVTVAPVSNSVKSSYLMANAKNQADEKTASVQFERNMQLTLNALSIAKHEEAIKDLEAANSYNNLMAKTLLMVQTEKLNHQLEDLAALERYENLMTNILNSTSRL